MYGALVQTLEQGEARMNIDFNLNYIYRRVVSWCSIRYEIIPFKRLLQEHYREMAMKGGAEG
jgi:hypothetical protein